MNYGKRKSIFVLSFLAFVFIEFSFCFALQIQPIYPKNKGFYDSNITSIKVNITSDYDINQVTAYVDNKTKGVYLAFDKSDGYYINDSINLGQGTHTITIVAEDSGGNIDKVTITFMVDEEPPMNESAILIDYTANKIYPNGSWYNSTNDLEKIIFHATDNLSGVKGFYLSYNQVQVKRGDPICGTVTLPNFIPANESSMTLSSSWIDAVRWVLYRAVDNAGNLGKIKCFVYKLDTQQPYATWNVKNEYYVEKSYLFNVTLDDPLNPENAGNGIESGISGINTSYLKPKIISNCSNLKITLVNKTKSAFNKGTFIYKLSVLYTRSSKEACELILTNATDIAGNLVDPSTIKKTIIVIGPPELKIISPKVNGTYNKCLWLNISSNKNVESCWFEDRDKGENRSMSNVNTTYASYYYCPQEGKDDGKHDFTFYCKDGNGITGYKKIEFYVDTTPPTVKMIYPVDNEYSKMENAQFDCEVSDNVKVKNVSLVLKNKNGKTILVLNNDSGKNDTEYKFYPKLDDFADGQYYWICKACDSINCENGQEYSFILDRTPPKIREIFPENNTVEKITEENVDNKTEYYVILTLKPIDSLSPELICSFQHSDKTVSLSAKNGSEATYKYVSDNLTKLEGWETWNIVCKDKAGNSVERINLKFYGDDKLPYTNTTTKSGWYNKPVNVTLHCFDNFKCKSIKYWINGKYNVSYGNKTTLELKKEGKYIINYYSVDEAGLNEKENHTLEINIDTETPRIKVNTAEGKIFYTNDVEIEFTPMDNIASYLTCYIEHNGKKSKPFKVKNGEKTNYEVSNVGYGKETIYIVCMDKANNTKLEKLNIYVYKGLSSSPLMQPFGPKQRLNLDKDKNITFSASEGYKTKFLVNSQNHTVEITNINGKTVTLEFHSKPVEINISEGETKYVDLNGDGINDIAVELLGVYSSMSAKIKIMLLKHKASLSGVLPPQSPTKETTNSNLTNNNIQTKNVENEVKTKQIASQKEKEEHKTKTLQRSPTGFLLSKRAKYILVALLILIIFCALYLIIGKKGNKK